MFFPDPCVEETLEFHASLLCPLEDGFSQRTKTSNPAELKATKKRNIGSTSGTLGELVRRLNSTCATGFQDPCILAIGDVALYQSLFQCVYHIAEACIPKQLGF